MRGAYLPRAGPTVHFVDEEYDTGPILCQVTMQWPRRRMAQFQAVALGTRLKRAMRQCLHHAQRLLKKHAPNCRLVSQRAARGRQTAAA